MSPAPRGPDTFRRIANCPGNKSIVELVVDYTVTDAAGFVLSVSRWHGVEKLEEAWRRSEKG